MRKVTVIILIAIIAIIIVAAVAFASGSVSILAESCIGG